MLVGIGLLGVLTATVASYFVERGTDETAERLARIETLLEQILNEGVVQERTISLAGSDDGYSASG
jgi:hypothetical protein